MNPEEVIALLQLQPHPMEGGFFRETYRCKEQVTYQSKLYSYSTAIYYLLTPRTLSEMHLLPTDEVFHFYLGDPVQMLQLWPDGSSRTVILGSDLRRGHQPQVVVPGGVWQGSFLMDGGKFGLMGATMAPGFEYANYQRGSRKTLTQQYPHAKELIEKLTPHAG